jgi:formyltetrahydrofolate-dependent phosphoribosylglycinamide formyltransferase
MLQRLQQKWKVNGIQLFLIILTFALGGSVCGYAGRKIINLFHIDQRWLWVIIYIMLITILWPAAVLLVSIPLGQFSFFKKYIKKIGRRLFGSSSQHSPLTYIAIFASGTGSNAQKIIDHFHGHPSIKIALIVTNNPLAGVLNIAKKEGLPTLIIEREKFLKGDAYLPELKEKNIQFIVLAGFLWKIPQKLIDKYPRHIINIHPALLPKYGGKGMYGKHVHYAVLSAGEKESGITIHYVDEHYDNGDVIFQEKCPVLPGDSIESLTERIHALEHKYYPQIIENVLTKHN